MILKSETLLNSPLAKVQNPSTVSRTFQSSSPPPRQFASFFTEDSSGDTILKPRPSFLSWLEREGEGKEGMGKNVLQFSSLQGTAVYKALALPSFPLSSASATRERHSFIHPTFARPDHTLSGTRSHPMLRERVGRSLAGAGARIGLQDNFSRPVRFF